MTKTKVMKCNQGLQIRENSGKWPCRICSKSVGRNSVQCQSCKKWIHKRCSGIRGRLSEGMLLECDRCTGKSHSREKIVTKASTQVQQDIELERVDKFCYLGDMIGGAGDAVRAHVKGAWAAFRELCPILTVRGASLRMKGRLYSAI